MKFVNSQLFMIMYCLLLLIFFSCTEIDQRAEVAIESDGTSGETGIVLDKEPWVGTFEGTCASYNMTDEYGQEIMIYGNYITIPQVKYTYKIFSNNTCSIYMDDGEDEISCHNVRYSASSNYNDFSLEIRPTSGSDCGGNTIILTGGGSSYKIQKGTSGEPSYNVRKIN